MKSDTTADAARPITMLTHTGTLVVTAVPVDNVGQDRLAFKRQLRCVWHLTPLYECSGDHTSALVKTPMIARDCCKNGNVSERGVAIQVERLSIICYTCVNGSQDIESI